MSNLDIVLEYARSIRDGDKIACVELKQVVERFFRALDNPAYEFRPERAESVVRLIEDNFRHTKTELRGQPFLLEPWEKFVAYNVAGFFRKGTDIRLYSEVLLFIPRKNGKTSFAAALHFAIAIDDARYAATLCMIANRLDRALEGFDFLRKNLEWMGELDEFRVLYNNNEHSMTREFLDDTGNETGSLRIEALASNEDKADGINAPHIFLDEIHSYKNATAYKVYVQAAKAYRHKLVLGVTTAGKSITSFGFHRMKYAQKILSGTIEDEQYFIFLTKADDPTDYTNPVEHEKANPNYGVTIDPQEILRESLEAQNDPSVRAEFLNKSLNIYTNAMHSYFDMPTVIESDAKYSWTLEELARLPIQWTGGADLSKMHDLTAGALYGEYQGVSIVIAHGFMPVTQAINKADEDDIPFQWWEEQGWLTMCNSKVVDFEEIVKWFIQMRKMGFRIRQVGFDKQYSREFFRSMRRAGFKMMVSDQQYWKKSEAFRHQERAIIDGKFYYLHNRAYEYCIGNVKAIEDSNEKVRYEKVDDIHRIDLFDAGTMGCKEAIILADKRSVSSFFEEGD